MVSATRTVVPGSGSSLGFWLKFLRVAKKTSSQDDSHGYGSARAEPDELDIFLLEHVQRVALFGLIKVDDLFQIMVVEDENATALAGPKVDGVPKTAWKGIRRVRTTRNGRIAKSVTVELIDMLAD